MGLDANGTLFLLFAREHGVDFSRTAMIGRQEMLIDADRLGDNLRRFGLPTERASEAVADGYSEGFFELLGADEVVSFDASGYEHASVQHDFNLPIPDQFKGKYTAVLDGGTLEHVFNYPQAIRNCMEMVAPGGHFLAITPANNQMGHGFYQFSPELFYRVLSAENGYKLERMMIFEEAPGGSWYDVADPDIVGERVTLINGQSTMLLIIARRVDAGEIFRKMPQQSDYASAWEGRRPSRGNGGAEMQGRSAGVLRRLRFAIERSRSWLNRRPHHFKRTDLP